MGLTEYGLFSDEGCIEADFYSIEEAQAAIADRYPEDDLTVEPMCGCTPECECSNTGCECEEDEEEGEEEDEEDW